MAWSGCALDHRLLKVREISIQEVVVIVSQTTFPVCMLDSGHTFMSHPISLCNFARQHQLYMYGMHLYHVTMCYIIEL